MKPLKKRHRAITAKDLVKKEGFTLIEILISLAIFGILTVLFSTLMGVAIQMRRNVFQQTTSSMELMKELAIDAPGLEREKKEIVLQFEGGKTLKIQGELRSQEGKDVNYQVFVPYE